MGGVTSQLTGEAALLTSGVAKATTTVAKSIMKTSTSEQKDADKRIKAATKELTNKKRRTRTFSFNLNNKNSSNKTKTSTLRINVGDEESFKQYLKDNGGHCDLGDKSPAELIVDRFKVSKKTYKKAVGDLYRQRLISINDDGITLL